MIEFLCPHCGKAKLRAPDEHAGKRGRCPKCHQPVQIPDAPREATPATAPTVRRQPKPQRAAPAAASREAQAVSALAQAASAAPAPAAPPSHSPAPVSAGSYYRPPKPVSKGFYLFSVLLPPILLLAQTVIMLGAAAAASASGSASNVGALGMIVSLVLGAQCLFFLAAIFGGVMRLVLLYKVWGSIPTDSARTSPGKAVGLLFVPLYNFAWAFTAYYGFAADYNDYLIDRGLSGPRLSLGVALCVASLPLVALVGGIAVVLVAMTDPRLGWVARGVLFLGILLADTLLYCIYVSQACNAVNYMALQARVART